MNIFKFSKEALKKYNITEAELYLSLALMHKNSVKDIIAALVSKSFLCVEVNEDTNRYKYTPTCEVKEAIASVVAESDSNTKPDVEVEKLATILKGMYPKGKKEGTKNYWAGGIMLIVKRLHLFYKKYGYNYTDEQIIEATKCYLDAYKDNDKYMQTLKYFIFKDGKGAGGSIECESQLLNYIENAGEDEVANNDDWLTNVN